MTAHAVPDDKEFRVAVRRFLPPALGWAVDDEAIDACRKRTDDPYTASVLLLRAYDHREASR